MDGDGPHAMPSMTAPLTTPGNAYGTYWDLAMPVAAHAPGVAWPAAAALVNVYEDLYPDSSAPSVASEHPFSSEVTPDMVLPALSAFPTYQQYTIQDSLLPEDSYAGLPPEYPLYNWTLPYGPEVDLRSMTAAGVSLSPSPSLAPLPPLPPHRSSRPFGVSGPSGIRTQFKGPSEIRKPCTQPDEHQLQQHAAGHLSALCPNLLPVDVDDAVVEVEVRTCRQDESSASERLTFDSVEDALASIEAQDQLDPLALPQTLSQTLLPVLGHAGHASLPPHSLQSVQECVAGEAEAGVAAAASRKPTLAEKDEKQDEVVKAAKSLFSKRTRTLYHWLYPDTSKTKLKATVSAAWDTLADTEKQFYLSQVLGRFGLQASSVIINPQLDGIKGLPAPELGPSWTGAAMVASPRASPGHAPPRPPHHALPPRRDAVHAVHAVPRAPPMGRTSSGPARASPPRPRPRLSEAQEAVNQLFASCADSDTWASYSCTSADSAPAPAPAAPRPAPKPRTLCGHTERRKRPASSGMAAPGKTPPARMPSSDLHPGRGPGLRLSAVEEQGDDDEVIILKEIRDARLDVDLEEDAELSLELDKFSLLASGGGGERHGVGLGPAMAVYRDGDEFWRGTPDPEEFFTQLEL